MISSRHFSHFHCPMPALLSDFLQESVGLSTTRIETLFDYGAIYVNGERTRHDCHLDSHDMLRVHFRPKRYSVPSTIEVIYEDENFLAIDKPSGLPTHPTLDNYLENASVEMQKRLDRDLYVTHRLDIGTEGVLIFAKSPDMQAYFNRLLSKRQVHKTYRAITERPVPVGRYVHQMEAEGPTPKRIVPLPTETSCEAILNVRKSWEISEGFACEIDLETGRTHQIRTQLSYLGCPILGDTLYGGTETKKFVLGRLALECFEISFAHRTRTIGIYRPTPLIAPHSTKDS